MSNMLSILATICGRMRGEGKESVEKRHFKGEKGERGRGGGPGRL